MDDFCRAEVDDFSRAPQAAETHYNYREFEAMLALLEGVEGRKMVVRDERAGITKTSYDFVWRRCVALRRLGRLDEAIADCERAAKEGGSTAVSAKLTIAKIHLGRGEIEKAFAITSVLVSDTENSEGTDWFTHGVVLDGLGKRSEARAAFQKALRLAPFFAPAYRALAQETHTPEERLADESQWQRAAVALDLAHCWHWYTELGLKDRAEACAVAGDEISPGRVAGQRVAHLAETNIEEALAEADRQLALHPHADIYGAKGWALKNLHRYEEARRELEKGAALDPTSWKVIGQLLEVCEELRDSKCVDEYEPRYYSERQLAHQAVGRFRKRLKWTLAALFVVGVTALIVARLRRKRSHRDSGTKANLPSPAGRAGTPAA